VVLREVVGDEAFGPLVPRVRGLFEPVDVAAAVPLADEQVEPTVPGHVAECAPERVDVRRRRKGVPRPLGGPVVASRAGVLVPEQAPFEPAEQPPENRNGPVADHGERLRPHPAHDQVGVAVAGEVGRLADEEPATRRRGVDGVVLESHRRIPGPGRFLV
jgi:hypothetical protein